MRFGFGLAINQLRRRRATGTPGSAIALTDQDGFALLDQLAAEITAVAAGVAGQFNFADSAQSGHLTTTLTTF